MEKLIGIKVNVTPVGAHIYEFELPIVKATPKQYVISPPSGWYGTHYRVVDVDKPIPDDNRWAGYVKIEAVVHSENLEATKKLMLQAANEKLSTDLTKSQKALNHLETIMK